RGAAPAGAHRRPLHRLLRRRGVRAAAPGVGPRRLPLRPELPHRARPFQVPGAGGVAARRPAGGGGRAE
ncbi:unnamed protein product, partial [Heterosigma akashiwo]